MNGLYIIGSAVIGLLLGAGSGNPLLGLVAGLAIGWLLARLAQLQKQLDGLASEVQKLRTGKAPAGLPEASQQVEAERAAADSPPAEPTARELSIDPARAGDRIGDSPAAEAKRRIEIPPIPAKPAAFERVLTIAKEWMTSGNVPAKVGMLVSFIGVSFLLKYAIDRELFNLPIEMRLLGVALAGLVMMAVGWRLRERKRTYALVLQGGGAGVLFLTVYAALRIWQLLPETAAFAQLVLIALATGFLAVIQNSKTLALFGVVGGFLAPVLASTGEGSHVALFSYYLVINGVVLGVAWFRSWRVLNLVGFGFTFIVSCYWGYNYFRPELFASTEPFLVLFFLFYQAVAILYAVRQPPEKLGVVDGTLVFGTPVIAFGLQSALLHGSEYGLAISATVLAVFYAACAAALRSRKSAYLNLLTESYTALAVAFGTIAIPLAFDAWWTAAAWALEGAALLWVGVRQKHHLANLAGFVLVLLAGFAFAAFGWRDGSGYAVLNGNVLGGLMISLAALFSSRSLERVPPDAAFQALYRLAALILFGWGVLWWLGTGWAEVLDRALLSRAVALMVGFTALSGVAAVLLGRKRSWDRMSGVAVFLLPLLLPFIYWAWMDKGHFLHDIGWLAWPLALAAQWFVLHDMDRRRSLQAGAWHIATLFLTVGMVFIEIHWRVDRFATAAWSASAAIATIGLAAMALWAMRRRPPWPVQAHAAAYLAASMLLVVFQSGLLAIATILMPGDPGPMPYLPVLNPLGLGTLFAGLTAFMALRIARHEPDSAGEWRDILRAWFVGALLVMTTAALVRAVHHYTGVPWRFDALFDSDRVQAALSIYWGLLGFAGMVAGARRSQRRIWLAGAGLMAVVVLKLFLVDLGNSGTVERIVSFIGTGVLLLVVGYFAPAPPKKPEKQR